MEPQPRIEDFLRSVRKRLNRRSMARVSVWTLLVVAGAMLAIALVYVVQGYAVPRGWYAASAVAGVIAAVAGSILLRANAERSAQFADQHFRLQDMLLSWLHFRNQHHTEGFYALQAEQAATRLQSLEPETVRWRPPGRIAIAAIALATLAVGLGFKGPSKAVLDELALQNATLARTAEINKELTDLLDDLNARTEDQEERELLNPDKLRELIEPLRETTDQKEALRQYAKLETQLQKARMKLEQRRDEQLLNDAAKELENERETKPLAQKFAQKEYKEASEELASMKPESAKSLSEQQKQLARLKAASQRMAAAVQNQRGRSGSSGTSRAEKGQSSTARSGGQSGSSGSASGAKGEAGGELGKAIENLASSVQELDESLSKATQQERETGKVDADTLGECQACEQALEKELDELAKYLKRMGIRCQARNKLAKLCQACGACQGGLCQSPNAGGKKAGMGSNTFGAESDEELIDNGNTTALQGIKGQGPSQTTVETADDGTGTSGRSGVAKKRSFERQVESFVSREDVPEQVKSGVKNYFESIHQVEETP